MSTTALTFDMSGDQEAAKLALERPFDGGIRRHSVERKARYLACLKAVTSISICIRGSARPAEIIIAAGRTSPKYFRSTGQHFGKSLPLGKT